MLQELKTSILEDGKIDAEEVVKLNEAIYADGKVDKEEADLLFDLNDAVSEAKAYCPEFETLFVDAITSYVLEDDETPGVVDPTEAAYIVEKISGDGALDELEQKLLKNIKAKAVSIDSSLDELMALVPGIDEVAASEVPPEAPAEETTES